MVARAGGALRMVVLVAALALPTSAWAAGWLLVPSNDFGGDDTSVTVVRLTGKANVVTNSIGVKGIALTFPTTFPGLLGSVIDTVAVCYKTANARTFITTTQLFEFVGPTGSILRHQDTTDHASTTDECYQSAVADYAPQGLVQLHLLINFGDVNDVVSLGAIAVHFK